MVDRKVRPFNGKAMVVRAIVDKQKNIEFLLYAYRELTGEEVQHEVEKYKRTVPMRRFMRYQIFTTIGLDGD